MVFTISTVNLHRPIASAEDLANVNIIRCTAKIKRLSHPKQPSFAKENDKVIHINHDHSISVELDSMNIGDISSEAVVIEALIDVESREELNTVTKQLKEAMKNNWYVIFDASHLCISDTGAIMFGCKASITHQTEQDLFLLK